MWLKETYEEACIGKHLYDDILIRNGLKRGNSLSQLFFNVALEYTITKIQENQLGLKLNGR